MRIQLTKDHFVWKKGQQLNVVRVIHHGGYTDDSRQYVTIHDGKEVCIRESKAIEISGGEEHKEREGVRKALIKRSQERARKRMLDDFVREQNDRMRAAGLSDEEIEAVYRRLAAKHANDPPKKPH